MKAFRIIAAVIAGIVILSVMSGKFLNLKGDVKAPQSVTLPEALDLPPLAELSPKQRAKLETFGKEMEQAINTNDVKWIEAHTSLDKVMDRVLHGFEFPSQRDLDQFRSGVIMGAKKNRGLLLSNALGGKAKFLRLRDVEGQGAALLRIITADGAMMLADLLPDFSEKEVKIVDAFQSATGTFNSESMRDILIPMFASMNRRFDSAAKGQMTALEDMMKAKQSGDSEAVIRHMKALPPEVQKRAAMRIIYLEALMSREDTAEYEKELLRIEREEPDDVPTAFKLMDLHVLKKHWAKAAAAARRVDDSVGGDAYLRSMGGMCLAYAGKFEDSAKAFEDAVVMEPDLGSVVVFRLHLDCARKDYAAAVRTLVEMEQTYQLQPSPEALAGDYPAVKAFVESPEYEKWKSAQ